MKNLLLNLYYDGYTLKNAIEFIERGYQETPKPKMIERVKNEIKSCTGKEWI